MRPIAVGCTFHCLAAKCVGNRVIQAPWEHSFHLTNWSTMCLRAEANVHATHVCLQNLHPGHLILKLNFRNAFICLCHNKMILWQWRNCIRTAPIGPLCMWFTILTLLWRGHHPVIMQRECNRATHSGHCSSALPYTLSA